MVSALVLLVWKREKITSNPFGYGALAIFTLFFGLGGLDPNFRLIITKPDNVPIVGLIFLLVFFVWYSMKEAVLNDRRIAKGEGPEEKAESDRVWVWPDLVYTELISLILCSVVLIVWSILLKAPLEQPANRAVTPNPVEGAVVLPGLAGNAGLLRSLARRRRAARADHRGADRDPVHRQERKGQRLLHVQRAEGRNHAVPVRVRRAVVLADRAGHVPARSELELLRAVRVLGPAQARGADQREPVGVFLGPRAAAAAAEGAGSVRELPGLLLVLFYVGVLPVILGGSCSSPTTTSWARRATT